jgi:MtN3 and saliva related transmembrane protein
MDEWLGYAAATLTTLSFVPQVVRVWRTRSARDLSLRMYLAFTAGVALWMLYGLRIGSWPVVIANGVTLLLAGAILVARLRFGGR